MEFTERQEECLAHRRKHGLIATEICFKLYCLDDCPVSDTCPLNDNVHNRKP